MIGAAGLRPAGTGSRPWGRMPSPSQGRPAAPAPGPSPPGLLKGRTSGGPPTPLGLGRRV